MSILFANCKIPILCRRRNLCRTCVDTPTGKGERTRECSGLFFFTSCYTRSSSSSARKEKKFT